MTNLFILCGIPGSGKSTWGKHQFDLVNEKNQNILSYVSRDEVRYQLISNNDEYFAKEEEVFDRFINHIAVDLTFYDNVIADATHLNKKSRIKLLKGLQPLCNNFIDINVICIVFNTPYEVCIERNARREGRAKVPEGVIKKMYHSFTDPSTDNINYYNILYIGDN